MVLLDFDENIVDDPAFLAAIGEYFAIYGKFQSSKYCHEKNFAYVLIQFEDRGKVSFDRCREREDLFLSLDQVDQIILDKPHFYKEHTLQVMKFLPSNIDSMNKKYARRGEDRSNIPDMSRVQSKPDLLDFPSQREPIDELNPQNEVFRLQERIKTMNDDFARQRKQLKEKYGEELRTLSVQTAATRRLQEDIEKSRSRRFFICIECCSSCLGYEKLLQDYQTIQQENEALNEQYLSAELENFEISSYYQQVLAEEEAKTVELEDQRAKKSQTTPNTRFSSTLRRGGVRHN